MTRLFIIRLILSHIDHCAIKIQKKIQKIQKIQKKKIAEFLCETEVCQLQGGKFHIRPRADMEFGGYGISRPIPLQFDEFLEKF